MCTLFEEIAKESEAKGRAEGEARGEQKFSTLTLYLLKDGKLEELARATSDREYKEKLYKEYGI